MVLPVSTPRALATSLAALLVLTACGGGTEDDASSPESAAARRPSPPPPLPADSTLALVSASATGVAASGMPCGVSADGSKVVFASSASTLVSPDSFDSSDIFLKDLSSQAVTRVVSAQGFEPAACVALTPDAQTLVFVRKAPSLLSALFVKNLATGAVTEATPPLATFPNVRGYRFAGVSDDGLRVAFIAEPTMTCSGYDCVALGPARMLLRDLATGQLIDLQAQVRFNTSQGSAYGNARLAGDGRSLAFSTTAAYLEVGDNNLKADVFSVNLDSGAVRQVNTDALGNAITQTSLSGIPMYGVQDYLVASSQVAYRAEFATTAGPAGVYVKDLFTGSLRQVLPTTVGNVVGYRAELSFSADANLVGYSVNYGSLAQVKNLLTGAVFNPATRSSGTVSNGGVNATVLLSANGRNAVFYSNATNLLAEATTSEARSYRKLLP